MLAVLVVSRIMLTYRKYVDQSHRETPVPPRRYSSVFPGVRAGASTKRLPNTQACRRALEEHGWQRPSQAYVYILIEAKSWPRRGFPKHVNLWPLVLSIHTDKSRKDDRLIEATVQVSSKQFVFRCESAFNLDCMLLSWGLGVTLIAASFCLSSFEVFTLDLHFFVKSIPSIDGFCPWSQITKC